MVGPPATAAPVGVMPPAATIEPRLYWNCWLKMRTLPDLVARLVDLNACT